MLFRSPAKPGPVVAAPATPPPAAPVAVYPPVDPIEPGKPGGLPDDRTPLSEAPFTPDSPNGAADVMQVYFALIGEKKPDEAWALWADGGRASGQPRDAFVAEMGRYIQYSGHVGRPGVIEGAAGSLHIEVPVQVFGRRAGGEPFHQLGVAHLSRVNDVPGSTAEQRLWRIRSLDVK